MIKLIIKYRVQEWDGYKYLFPVRSKIMTFQNIEDITNQAIESVHNGWVEILEIKQILA